MGIFNKKELKRILELESELQSANEGAARLDVELQTANTRISALSKYEKITDIDDVVAKKQGAL